MSIDERLQEGIAAHRKGDLETAQDIYLEILNNDPKHPDGLHFLGLLHFDAGQSDSAIDLIQRSLELNERNTSALNNLGNILKLIGEPRKAFAAYVRAVEYDSRHEDAWKNINLLLRSSGDYHEILTIMSEIVRLDPENPSAWNTYGLALMFTGSEEEAAEAIDKSLRFDDPKSPTALWRARILSALGKTDLSQEHFERIVEAEPDNEAAHYHLAAVRGDDLEQAPENYVKSHFDKFSDSFDTVLENLGYRAPELVAEDVVALAVERGAPFQDVADLGCGTGLCGPLIDDHCTRLTGVDLSQGMMRKAAELKVYDFLVEGELVSFLNSDLPTKFDLAVCVDTLCYIGNLKPFMHALANALKPGGILVASVEHLVGVTGTDFRVDSSGRYAHTPDYIRRCAEEASLVYKQDREEVLRKELGKDVNGLIFQIQLPEET
ncbi:tetratricopeptide repeat protein [uncultured Roseibium sp.]|uniref:tetratricopeptide repeat protein n=1 Tax=uncultured Roseibium sp. TaxID=1936171 RepID=UPI0026029105|nr:tetratricopeptide repeat protein [uncultured Roseibium sp.]